MEVKRPKGLRKALLLALGIGLCAGNLSPALAATIDKRVNHGNDDVEQQVSNGQITRNSSDLEMAYDGSTHQIIGIRFKSILIPQGSTITNAYIVFQAKGTTGTSTSLTIWGHDVDNSPFFKATSYDLSGRTKTSASVSWSNIAAWSVDNDLYQTTDIKDIVQEIVNIPGWVSGNKMAFIIEGSGTRKAYSYNGNSAKAALLHVEYSTTQVLSVSTLNWIATPEGDTSSSISVYNSGGSGPFSYAIADDQTWLSVSASSGTSDGTFTTTATPNSTGSARSGMVTVTAAGITGSPKYINVTQESQGASPFSMNDYTNYPIFMSTNVTPDVLVILDSSGSMLCQAYHHLPCDAPETSWDDTYSPMTDYYGYFNSSKQYTYTSKFVEDPAGDWSGNFLNWIGMRRIDIAKKVLIGGKANPRPSHKVDPHTLKGESATSPGYDWQYFKRYDRVAGEAARLFPPCGADTYCWFGMDAGYIYMSIGATPFASYLGKYQIWVEVEGLRAQGIIHDVSEKVRLGIEFFNSDQGGFISRLIEDPPISTATVLAIENLSPGSSTPLAESLWTATGYFAKDATTGSNGPRYFSSPANSYPTSGANYDPYEFASLGQTIECCKVFVLMLTDGQATNDTDIPSTQKNAYNGSTHGYLDDVALWAHTNDLRPDLDGTQSIVLYTVGMFGAGGDALKSAAKAGGFEDSNGNGVPDDSIPAEWDLKNNATGLYGPDGIPDNYFEASTGEQLEESLNRAFSEILSRATSGTAISVLATSSSGAGNIFQAYFLPRKTILDAAGSRDLTWLGHLLSLKVDATGHLRDVNDNCIKFEFDEVQAQTLIKTLTQSAGLCTTTETGSTPLTSFVGYNWEAGSELLAKAPSARTIYTFMDEDQDGVVDGGEFITFETANATALQKYLRAGSVTEAENIIKFTRGEPVTGYRDRSIGGDQWKLGDIVYSTPSVLVTPQEAYGLLYQDSGFSDFFNSLRSRPVMVIVGSNDGMLHAFNVLTGEEEWAYIPYNFLPHLKWLTDPDYTHVDGVDLKIKLTDINFGTTAAPNWKTIMIGGMRMGGGEITDEGYDVDGDGDTAGNIRKWRSSYFVFDITYPDNPVLIWEFGHNLTTFMAGENDLGFTLTYPSIVKVGDNFFAIFGSGSQAAYLPNYQGIPDQTGKVLVVDIKTGALAKEFEVAADATSMFGDPISVDIDFSTTNPLTCPTCPAGSYGADVVYIGETYWQSTGGGSWNGRLWRIVIDHPDPANWVMYNVFNTQTGQPIISASASAADSLGNVWLYVGTGKYYSDSDKVDTNMQTMYGVKDPCWDSSTFSWDAACLAASSQTTDASYSSPAVSLGDLFDSTDAIVKTDRTVLNVPGASNFGELRNLVSAKQGWYMNLPTSADPAERILNKASVLGGLVLFTSFQPSEDPCGYSGSSYFYSLFYETGTAFYTPTIGLAGDIVLKRSATPSTGLASSVAIHAGKEEGAKAYIQLSTGEAKVIELQTAFNIKSGIISWRDL